MTVQKNHLERIAALRGALPAGATIRAESDPELLNLVRQGNQAIEGVRSDVDELRERVNDMEAGQNRQGLGGSGASPDEPRANPERKKALAAYMRQGEQVSPDVKAELSVGSDPNGGYLVEPDTSGRISELIYQSSPIRRVANVQPIGTESLQGLYDLDEAGSGWVGEMDDRGETDTPDLGQWEIYAHEMYALPKATTKILEDADRNLEKWLIGNVTRKFARDEASAFVTGNGVKKPRGILDHDTDTAEPTAAAWQHLQIVKTGASGAFDGTAPADVFYDTLFSLKPEYHANAVWMMNRATMAEVGKLKDGQGNYLLQPANFSGPTPFQILGFPVVLADDMPQIAADSRSIAFGDFGVGYQIADRRGITLLRDPYTTKGKVKFYVTRRVGGDVVNFEAIKLIQFSA